MTRPIHFSFKEFMINLVGLVSPEVPNRVSEKQWNLIAAAYNFCCQNSEESQHCTLSAVENLMFEVCWTLGLPLDLSGTAKLDIYASTLLSDARL